MLYYHQKKILLENPAKRLLCWETGTGKSLAAIELVKKNRPKNVLLICPKALKEKWYRDIENHSADEYMPWTVMSKEEFRRDWEDIPGYETIIIDEAHYFAGHTSQMSKNMLKYLKVHKPEYIYLLTATPYMSTPWNIYTLARILGYTWNYYAFKIKFFFDKRVGSRFVPAVRPNMEFEIADLVNEIGSVVRLEDCADVPEQVFETEYFSLSEKQVTAVRKVSAEEINPIVKYTKHHQIENGSLKDDGYSGDQFFDSSKFERIADLALEHPKLAVVCRYNLQIDHLAEYLKETGKPIYIIRGDVKNRDEIVQRVERDPECVVLINAACSEGYELPSVGVIVFASLSFSYKDYVQMLGRFLRINKLKKNVYLHLVASDGIDEAVYQSIKRKEDFYVEIYASEQENGVTKR